MSRYSVFFIDQQRAELFGAGILRAEDKFAYAALREAAHILRRLKKDAPKLEIEMHFPCLACADVAKAIHGEKYELAISVRHMDRKVVIEGAFCEKCVDRSIMEKRAAVFVRMKNPKPVS
jgi:hypothetical protein